MKQKHFEQLLEEYNHLISQKQFNLLLCDQNRLIEVKKIISEELLRKIRKTNFDIAGEETSYNRDHLTLMHMYRGREHLNQLMKIVENEEPVDKAEFFLPYYGKRIFGLPIPQVLWSILVVLVATIYITVSRDTEVATKLETAVVNIVTPVLIFLRGIIEHLFNMN